MTEGFRETDDNVNFINVQNMTKKI